MPPQQTNVDPRFTVFVRLPFPRGDFVDPPPPEWDASKDRVLWDVLSQPSKGNDIDWKALAEHFDVTLPFLLQQAAWLYDRQLSQVRAQIRRVGSQNPLQGTSSSVGGTPGSQPMARVGSSGSGLPSKLSLQQRDSQTAVHDSSVPSTPLRSRGLHTISPNMEWSKTMTSNHPPGPTRRSSVAPRPQSPRDMSAMHQRSSRRSSAETTRPVGRRESRTPVLPPLSPRPDEESSEPLSSVSSESDSDDSNSQQGAPFKRFGRFSMQHKPMSSSNEDDEEDSPAFLPLEAPQETAEEYEHTSQQQQPLSQPYAQRTPRVVQGASTNRHQTVPESSNTSSISSGMNTSSPIADPQQSQRSNRHIGALSPRRAAELSGTNTRGSAIRRETSDGTPSMGSSFSDLDDASITQSALEEALLSKMQHGGVASRMSTLSQALRSKYL